MRTKTRNKDRKLRHRFWMNGTVGLFLILFTISVVLPLVWVVYTSFKTTGEIFQSPWAMPEKLQFDNYSSAFSEKQIGHMFWNSLVVTVSTLLLLLPIGSMAAYIFAKYPFRFSQGLFSTFLGGMMFPVFLTILPLFMLMSKMGMVNSLFGLVLVYVAYSLPFTIFVMTGFFQALPHELTEAAMLDGCGHVRAFTQVMLPLAKPGLIVVGVFNAIGLWNEYPLALVLLTKEDKYTLPLGIANLAMNDQYRSQYGPLFAALVLVMIPILVVYWIFRDKIHETMLAGALKG